MLNQIVKAFKTITSIPGWGDGSLSHRVVKSEAQAYNAVPLIRFCVDLIASSISSVPTKFIRGETEVDWLYDLPIKRLLHDIVMSYEIYGAAYIQKIPNQRGQVLGLRVINGDVMKPEYLGTDANGKPLIQFRYSFGENKIFRQEEIIYIRKYNPVDDIQPGKSDTYTAFEAAKVVNYLTLFGSKYFDSGAMPTTLLVSKTNPPPAEKARVENWFKRRMTGIRNVFNAMLITGEIDIKTFTPPAKDLAIPELSEHNRMEILDAYGVPEGMIRPDSNRSNTVQQTLSFWQTKARPLGEMIAEALNEQLFAGTRFQLQLNFDEMDIFQEDEKQRAFALNTYVLAGFPLAVAGQMLGIELPEDVTWADIQAHEESRVTVQRTGGFAQQDPDLDPADLGLDTKAITITSPTPLLTDDLGKWETKAIKRLKTGKSMLFDFDTTQIPVGLQSAIRTALENATSKLEIKAIFDDIRIQDAAYSWQAYG